MKIRSRSIFCILLISLLSAGGCKAVLGLVQADLLMDINRYEQAINIYEDHLQNNPATAGVLAKMGFAYFKSNRLERAEVQFREALVLDPAQAEANLYLGLVYMRQKNFRLARETWRGYRNKEAPLVEEEMRRLTTLAYLAETRDFARKVLKQEKQLQTVAGPADTIAVSQFKNLAAGPEMAAFGKGLSAMVVSDLAKVKELQVVERIMLQALLEEMALGQTGVVAAESAPRVGKLLGVANLVVGGLAEGIEVNSSLVNVGSSVFTATTALVIPPEKFFELPAKIVIDVAAGLGVPLSKEELADIGQTQTTSYKAVVFYGRGLQAFDDGDWASARELFGMARAEDPAFLLAREADESCPGSGYPVIWGSGSEEAAEDHYGAFAEQAVGHAMAEQDAADEEDQANAGDGGGGD